MQTGLVHFADGNFPAVEIVVDFPDRSVVFEPDGSRAGVVSELFAERDVAAHPAENLDGEVSRE